MLTNSHLKKITQENYNGGDHGGYAWYNRESRQINLSKTLVEGTKGLWGRLTRLNEFQSVLTHEVGHAASYKLGREESLKYKEFVVSCGWSYEQEHLRRGMTATGSDRDIPREGSMSHLPLLTEYAHKSPEEAFAEYYSIYHNNKKEIDHWLNTGESSVLGKTHKTIVNSTPSKRTVGQALSSIKMNKSPEETYRLLRNLHLESNKHISVELISPWEARPSELERRNYDPSHIRDNLRYNKDLDPIVTVNDHNRYEILDGVNRQVSAKYLKKPIASISISKELYSALSQRGYSDRDITEFAVHDKNLEPVPHPQSIPKQLAGIEFRNSILSIEELKKSENIFRRMRAVYNSEELKKALEDLLN